MKMVKGKVVGKIVERVTVFLWDQIWSKGFSLVARGPQACYVGKSKKSFKKV